MRLAKNNTDGVIGGGANVIGNNGSSDSDDDNDNVSIDSGTLAMVMMEVTLMMMVVVASGVNHGGDDNGFKNCHFKK